MKRILVSAQAAFIPLLRQLSNNKSGYELISLHDPFLKLLRDADIPVRALGEALTPQDRAVAPAVASNLHVAAHQLRPQPDSLSSTTQLWLASGGLASYFYPRLIDTCLVLTALARLAPDLIILHNDVEPLHRLLALWGVGHGVPVLHVPHAIYLETDERGPMGSDIHDLVTADHLAAAGPYQAAWYRARSATQHIYVTGLPQFDRLAHVTRDRTLACQLFHLDPYRPVLVYMSSWAQRTHLLGCHSGVEETYSNLLTAMRSLPEVQLIVKCHPRGNNLTWHRQEAERRGVPCVVTAEHLDATLMAADAVLSYGPSNVVLEAACVPEVRLLAIDGFRDDPEVVTLEATAPAIVQAVTTALRQPPPATHALLAKYLGAVDGGASTRIAQLVQQLVG